MNSKGWDNLETFGGGEERWTTWSWKVKVATGAMEPNIRKFMEKAENNEGNKLRDLDDTDGGMEEHELQ